MSDSIWSSAAVLLFVMDPLGNIPIMLSILKDVEPKRRKWVVLRELFIALGILLLFLFTGQAILNFLHLQQESVTIAGGIVLMIIGLRLIFPQQHGVMGKQIGGEPFIVPIAIPMVAGPSTLATLILMVRQNPSEMTKWFFTLMIAWTIVAVTLMMAPLLYKLLREKGLAAVERLMGMLLVMMSVQMLVNGLKTILKLG